MHTAYIDYRVILSLHANILDFRQSALSFIIGLNNDRSAFKARSQEPCKAISIYAHHDNLQSFAQLAISVPNRRKGLTSDRRHGQQTNTYKSARGSRSVVPYSAKTYVFTRAAPRTKSKGLLIGGPLLSNFFAFYMLSTAYKKEGAPDRWSLTQ
jgi:hypothetical protein